MKEVAEVPAAVTLLSGLIHAHDPDPEPVLRAAAIAMARLDADHGALYCDLLSADLDPAQRQILEAQMDLTKNAWKSDFARHHRAEGKAEGTAAGQARSLLAILEARQLPPTAAERARIAAEVDPARLDRWIVRALTAATVAQLLADDA